MIDYAVVPRAETVLAEPTRSDQRFAMSYEQFLVWAEERHAEWVDGEVIVFMPPGTRHQKIVGFLYLLLQNFIDTFRLGTVLLAPFEMCHMPGRASREPDLLFVANENLHCLTPERLYGPADLVVEVVSSSSVARDRTDKFYEYQETGIPEYWIIDPRPGYEQIDMYMLSPQGHYRAGTPDADGRYHSTVLPGFWLLPEWLWQEPLPTFHDTLSFVQQMIEP